MVGWRLDGLGAKSAAAALAIVFATVGAVPTYGEDAPAQEPVDGGAASDEITMTEQEPTRTTRAEIEAAHIPDGEITGIADHYGITDEQARQRIQVEMATVGLDERLGRLWPNSYGGSWHADDGGPEVVVGFAGHVEDVEERRGEVAKEFAYPEHLVIRTGLARSLAEIEHAYWRLADDIERLTQAPDEPAPSTPDAEDSTPAPEEEPEMVAEDEEPDYGAPLWGRRFVPVAASEDGQPRPLPSRRQPEVSFT